ncbi:MAG: helix-turn-helix transcriptional regulator, partial [Proteobacteria bacterium]|nr:helix-turn-helix transcriptional regulator [Pseudomonadota bacterium]
MPRAILGTRIRERRRGIGITQAELARRIGISASYLNLIERNKVARQTWDLADLPEFKDLVVRLESSKTPVPAGFDKLSVLIDGVKNEFAVPKLVADALKGLTLKQADMVSRMARVSSGLLRAGATTFNIGFTHSNALRDF